MYVYFDITDEGLVFSADDEAQGAIREALDNGSSWYDVESEVLEYAVCNGLSYVRHEDIGALTDATILADGDIEDPETQYFWYPNYMVSDWLEILADTGSAVWTKAE